MKEKRKRRTGKSKERGKRVLLVIWMLSVAAAGAYAEVTVTYTEGFPRVLEDGSWRDLYIGAAVSEDAVLQLEEGEYVELESSSGIMRFDSPGRYELTDLIGRIKESDPQSTVIGMVGERLNSTVRGTDYRVPSAAGGVRGAEAGPEDEPLFMESEAMDLIRRGRELLKGTPDRERLETAARYFEEASLYASGPAEEHKARFYLGYVAIRRGMAQEAMQHLAEAEPAPETEYYSSYILLAGRVYLLNERPRKTASLLEEADRKRFSPEELLSYRLLLGIALIDAGRAGEAVEHLEAVSSAEQDSDAGMAARQLLQGISE